MPPGLSAVKAAVRLSALALMERTTAWPLPRIRACRWCSATSGFLFFYSNEVSPREPVHVHVRSGSSAAKLWLEPQVRVAASFGFDAGTLRELVEVAQSNRVLIERTWHEYFS